MVEPARARDSLPSAIDGQTDVSAPTEKRVFHQNIHAHSMPAASSLLSGAEPIQRRFEEDSLVAYVS